MEAGAHDCHKNPIVPKKCVGFTEDALLQIIREIRPWQGGDNTIHPIQAKLERVMAQSARAIFHNVNLRILTRKVIRKNPAPFNGNHRGALLFEIQNLTRDHASAGAEFKNSTRLVHSRRTDHSPGKLF